VTVFHLSSVRGTQSTRIKVICEIRTACSLEKCKNIALVLSGFNELIKVIMHHMIQWPLLHWQKYSRIIIIIIIIINNKNNKNTQYIGQTGLIRPDHSFSYPSKFFFGYIPFLLKKFCIYKTSKVILLRVQDSTSSTLQQI
jgi:hypothetical protein